jgi:hypothetical protein
VKRFDLTAVRCSFCGEKQAIPFKGQECRQCPGRTFAVELERSASGVDVENLLASFFFSPGGAFGALVNETVGDGDAPIYFKTHSLLECDGVSAAEIVSFLATPGAERRKMYVAWKRRELEESIAGDRRICGRCKVSYRVYANTWNKAGYCSNACHQAQRKSRSRGK